MSFGVWLSKEDCLVTQNKQNLTQPYAYLKIVGSLIYSIIEFRPDCAYAVCSLAQHLSNYSNSHIHILKCTLRYMKGTLSFGIKYQKQENRESYMASLTQIGLVKKTQSILPPIDIASFLAGGVILKNQYTRLY